MQKVRLDRMKQPAYIRRKNLTDRIKNVEVLLLKLHEGIDIFSNGVNERIRAIERLLHHDDCLSGKYYVIRSLDPGTKYKFELMKLTDGGLVLVDGFEDKEAAVEFYKQNIKE